MAAAAVATVAMATSPIPLPLPAPPPIDFWTAAQWETWYALVDTIVPAIVEGDGEKPAADNKNHLTLSRPTIDTLYATMRKRLATDPEILTRDAFAAYLAEPCSSSLAYRENMARSFSLFPPHTLAQLGGVLSLLGSRWFSFLFLGYGHAGRTFAELGAAEREAVLQGWMLSRFATFRGLAKSVGLLAKKAWLQTSPGFDKLSGWPHVPEQWKPYEVVRHHRQLEEGDEEKTQEGEEGGFRFIQFPAGTVTHETDILIVGSGCGGGVCAKVLAEAGHKVTVVEKGYHYPPSQLPMRPDVAESKLFDTGIMSSDDGNMTVIAGSNWGGGGTVNWGVSLRTPDYIRRDWADKHRLPFFATKRYDECLDRVCDTMGVDDQAVRQSSRGQMFLDGCAALGMKGKTTPHNSGREADAHHCAHCHLGCSSGGKRGPNRSWLPAAARAGAEFIEGFAVEKVLFESFAGCGQKAVGVRGMWTSRDKDRGTSGPADERVETEVTIRAKKVIISGGSLWSPVILQKSGLGNPHIGRNLFLHPVNTIAGFWKDDQKPWDGCAITSVCADLENLDGQGYGTKLEPLCMVPLLPLTNLVWRSGLDYKLTCLRYRHSGTFFSMPRDRDTGRVWADKTTGNPTVTHPLSDFDRAHGLEGIVALARICYASGAEEVRPFLPGIDPFIRREDGDDEAETEEQEKKRFEDWILQLRKVGNPPTAPWGSAHQMGSCRMSAAAEDGVVDPRGKVWGFEGLYVADASVLPTASSVNPMVTTMAIADHIARGIAQEMKG